MKNDLTLAECGIIPLPDFTKTRKAAFTLAEVLITLGIIGIVAALTMPSLIAKYQEKQTVVQLKKAYNTLGNAFKMAVLETGEINEWGLTDSSTSSDDTEANLSRNAIINKIQPYIKGEKVCELGDEVCVSKNKYDRFSLDGTAFSYFYPIYKMPDGTSIVAVWINSAGCKMENTSIGVCGQIFIDLNGSKMPNATGKDIFLFWFTKNGTLIPMGTTDDADYTMRKFCNLEVADNINGYSCTAWVLLNENMDYLHCKGIDWDNPDKCK